MGGLTMANRVKANASVPKDNHPDGVVHNAEAVHLDNLLFNVWQTRYDLFRQFIDPKRDIDRECGYPQDSELQAMFYRQMYQRHAPAERVCQLMPKQCWQVAPSVFEEEESSTESPFEKDWKDLGRQLSGTRSWYKDESGSMIWHYLCKADVLSGIGHYGVILIGLDDGLPLDMPAEGANQQPDGSYLDAKAGKPVPLQTMYGPALGTEAMYGGIGFSPGMFPDRLGYDFSPGNGTGIPPKPVPLLGTGLKQTKAGTDRKRRLLFLRCFDEAMAPIMAWENDPYNPRYGQPLYYNINFYDPSQPMSGIGLPNVIRRVHWSRIVHIALTGDDPSEVFAKPQQRPVINELMNLKKLYGGSGEMYWRGAFPGISLETHPQLGPNVKPNTDSIRQMMTSYGEGLQRYLMLAGMTAKSLAPQVTDPKSFIDVQIGSICIEKGCPVRIFMGSERGELASGQDDGQWNDTVRHSQYFERTPKVLVPLIDRLIAVGVLTEPEGYGCEWPGLDSLSEKDKAQVALTKTQAISVYASTGVEAIIAPLEFLTNILGMEDEEAQAILTATKKAQEEEDGGESPLSKMVGGITGMIEMYKLAAEGGISVEQLKQMLMYFYKVSEEDADTLIADGLEKEAQREEMEQEAHDATVETMTNPPGLEDKLGIEQQKVDVGAKAVEPKAQIDKKSGVEGRAE